MSMTLEEVIAKCEERVEMLIESMNACDLDDPVEKLLARNDAKCAEEHRQLADWLRELQERRKADSCEGCKNIGLWENEYEYGVSCPCLRCARRAQDNYEPERRTVETD